MLPKDCVEMQRKMQKRLDMTWISAADSFFLFFFFLFVWFQKCCSEADPYLRKNINNYY